MRRLMMAVIALGALVAGCEEKGGGTTGAPAATTNAAKPATSASAKPAGGGW